VRDKSTLIARDCVLVNVQVDLVADEFNSCAIYSFLAEIDHEKMVIGTTRNDIVAEGLELFHHGQSIGEHLLLILLKLHRLDLFQRDSDSSDGVVVGTTLQTREHCRINLLLQLVLDLIAFLVFLASNAIIDQSTSRTPQSFVCSCSHNICLPKRAWNHPSSHEPRGMSNISEQVGSNRIAYLSELFVVE
jgi:hypothetical protein